MIFGRIFKEAANGVRRNFSMFVSIVLVTFISLTFVGAAALLQMQIGQMKTYWYDKAQVAIYMCTDFGAESRCAAGAATEADLAGVQAMLESEVLDPYISEFYFEDHELAYTNFTEQFAGSPVLEYVQPEQLAQTFWVNLEDPDQWRIINESFSEIQGVDEVRDQRSYLDKIFNIINIASYTAIGIAVLMLVVAVLLITTTIRLSAFARRKELGIMRLVGASNFFIQTPFILEGVVAALVGSLFAGGSLVLAARYFIEGYLAESMLMTSLIGTAEAFLIWPALVLLGILLAAFASGIAIRRYLKI